MRDLVFALAHAVVAQAEREDQFIIEHRGPELDFRRQRVDPPGVIAALEDRAFDCPSEIDPPKLVLARQARHHLEAQALARAATRSNLRARIEGLVEMSSAPHRRAYPIER